MSFVVLCSSGLRTHVVCSCIHAGTHGGRMYLRAHAPTHAGTHPFNTRRNAHHARTTAPSRAPAYSALAFERGNSSSGQWQTLTYCMANSIASTRAAGPCCYSFGCYERALFLRLCVIIVDSIGHYASFIS
eukprot:5436185-Pleurochrysis_carterae.AAC.1